MRQDAWRRDAASYPLRGELQPRYTDVDVWQHLNNGALISMHGEAVQQKLRSVFGPAAWRQREPALACARNATDFLSEAHYPAPVQWGARVLGADASGLRVATALFQHGHCVGLHEATLTGWSGGQAAGLTPEHRAALQTARVPATELAEPDGETAGTPILADFPWQTALSTRFADSDAHRLASDTCLARAAEQMRVEFLHQVFEHQRPLVGGMMVAHVSLRWLQRSAPAAQWRLAGGVSRMGERSLGVRGAIFEADRCVAICDSVMVAIDRESRASAPLSDEARALMNPYRLAAPAG